MRLQPHSAAVRWASLPVAGTFRRCAWVGAAYLVAVAVMFTLVQKFDASASWGWLVTRKTVWMGLPVALIATCIPTARGLARYWQVVWCVYIVFALCNSVLDIATIQSYGDAAYIGGLIERAEPFPKWLAGIALLDWVYVALWRFPPFVSRLPVALVSSAAFLRLASVAVMGAGTLALLRRWPHRLAALLPTLTPIWILFASGYLEYYPYIAGAFVAALLWLFDQPLQDKAPRTVGLVTAALMTLYIGFIPFALCILLFCIAARPRNAGQIVASAAVSFVVLVVVCYPAGVTAYLSVLQQQMLFGEAFLGFARYKGQVAGANSIFFTSRYALSAEHLGDVVSMALWGGGLAAGALLLVGGALVLWRRAAAWRAWGRDWRVWLGCTLVLWQLAYLLFMVPKLGPTHDVDLFFTTYLTLAFFAGHLLDQLMPDVEQHWRGRAVVTTALLATTAVSSLYLIRLGLPVRL